MEHFSLIRWELREIYNFSWRTRVCWDYFLWGHKYSLPAMKNKTLNNVSNEYTSFFLNVIWITCRLCRFFEQINICFIDFAGQSAQTASLLLQCQYALKIESHFQELLKPAILLEDVSKTHVVSILHLLIIEKQLLNLSSNQKCTDGILYGLPILFEWNKKTVFSLCFYCKNVFTN